MVCLTVSPQHILIHSLVGQVTDRITQLAYDIILQKSGNDISDKHFRVPQIPFLSSSFSPSFSLLPSLFLSFHISMKSEGTGSLQFPLFTYICLLCLLGRAKQRFLLPDYFTFTVKLSFLNMSNLSFSCQTWILVLRMNALYTLGSYVHKTPIQFCNFSSFLVRMNFFEVCSFYIGVFCLLQQRKECSLNCSEKELSNWQ